MNDMNDGGPAFPAYMPAEFSPDDLPKGMSLRDWFAGQALGVARQRLSQEALYRNDGSELPPAKVKNYHPSDHDIAERAYALADAMLAAREPKP